MIEIRKAIVTDAEYISLLGRVTYTESHGKYIKDKKDLLEFYSLYYSVSKIREELKDPKNIFWIVISDELPIGFAKLSLNIGFPTSVNTSSCRLLRLYILNDFIALKIGSQLIKIILQEAINLKFDTIWLSSYYKNKKGINFYKKYDFNKIGNIDFIVGNTNYENLVFAKTL